MVAAADVFTPNSFPTYTYVERTSENLEDNLRHAVQIKNAVISLSGPSKSGKTVLFKKIIDPDNQIYVSGSSIKAPGDLWRIVLSWMGGAVASTESTIDKMSGSAKGSMEVSAGVVFAKGGLSGSGEATVGRDSGSSKSIAMDGLTSVAREIANSDFIVFVDDFHYIPASVQNEVSREIKAGAESGIRFCVASVPHRSDDVVRSNAELRGRVSSIDTKYWTVHELSMIADKGFSALNVELAPAIVRKLAEEAFGSPQLMQAICLHLAFKMGVYETRPSLERIEVTEETLSQALELAAAGTSFQSLLESLHSGPRQRGTERKEFSFYDGSKGDVYRSILLAMREDPGRLNFNYDEMQRRVKSICVGSEVPVGGSITRSLEQMDEICGNFPPKALEWQDDILQIVDPYFLFYLRSSRKLGGLA